jgi:hypothetical protein
MSKRHKNRAKQTDKSQPRDMSDAKGDDTDGSVMLEPHPPTRRPFLLGISALLFVLWLIFLLVTAWPR